MKNFIALFMVTLFFLSGITQGDDFSGTTLDEEFSEWFEDIGMELRNDGNIMRQVSETTLHSANTLSDLYVRFPAEWMASYNSVDITIICNGEPLTARGTSHDLSQEQKDILKFADYGSDVKMEIVYIADNNLKSKEPRFLDFSFKVTPASYASFKGGKEEMIKYLEGATKEKLIDKKVSIKEWTTVKFTIDENGNVDQMELLKSSDNELADQIIKDAFNNMPQWNPAVTAKGKRVTQDFRFYIGNLQLCSFYEG